MNTKTVKDITLALHNEGSHNHKAAPAQAQHSPLPWTVEDSISTLFDSEIHSIDGNVASIPWRGSKATAQANAAYIVRACNNAQRLADVAKKAMEFAIYIIEENATPTLEECVDVREATREALAEWSKQK